jgi:hypothetical protein
LTSATLDRPPFLLEREQVAIKGVVSARPGRARSARDGAEPDGDQLP